MTRVNVPDDARTAETFPLMTHPIYNSILTGKISYREGDKYFGGNNFFFQMSKMNLWPRKISHKLFQSEEPTPSADFHGPRAPQHDQGASRLTTGEIPRGDARRLVC
jgi:hypothetical protein